MKKKAIIMGVAAGFFIVLGRMGFILFRGGFPEVQTRKEQYGTWKKFTGYSGLRIFPETVSEQDITYYYYKSRNTIFSPECQICLKTTYGEDAFEKEVDRISQISITYDEKTNEILKDTDNFNVQAYIAEFNWNHCYEYALVFPETKQVTYVFVQNVKKSEVKFDTGELPVHYEQKNNTLSYCIYAFGTGKNEMYYE